MGTLKLTPHTDKEDHIYPGSWLDAKSLNLFGPLLCVDSVQGVCRHGPGLCCMQPYTP